MRQLGELLPVVLVAATLLFSCPPTSTTGADAFQRGRKRCQDARDFGPVRDGLPCSQEGLTCSSNQPACTGVFDDDTQSWIDTYLPCTCTRAAGGAARNNNKTWACPAAKCRAPDKRCQCRDNGSVGEGLACYREGLNCPIYGYVVGCYNMWNDDLKICENYTAILGECDCYRGAWMCSYGDCRIPSYECDPDYYPPDYSP